MPAYRRPEHLPALLHNELIMNVLNKYTSPLRLLLISLIPAVFIIYPNGSCLPWELNHMEASEHSSYLLFFAYRLVYILIIIWLLLLYNLKRIETAGFKKRLLRSFILTTISYLIYVAISLGTCTHGDCFTGLLLFQFAVVWIICSFIGHLSYMYTEHVIKDKEIEKLKTDNLQSRCDALTNQINPHFFFNSLNGLSYLIRSKNEADALQYIGKLSDVFRYILQSDKKGLVRLSEELEFVKAFFYMMEIRYANKLVFNINVPDDNLNYKLPVLSLLPLIENVVMHNMIDSDHKMEVRIEPGTPGELIVSNPVYPKIAPSETNGTGLKNLESRFQLLMNRQIRTTNDGTTFTVYLPLKKESDENPDS